MKTICDENDLEFIDNYDNVFLTSGEIPASYFQKDKLHLNTYGTRRRLSNINKIISVTKYTPRSNKSTHIQGSHPNQNNTRLQVMDIACHQSSVIFALSEVTVPKNAISTDEAPHGVI